MPEHFHMLISEPQVGTPSTVMQVLKQRFAHQIRRGSQADVQPSSWEDKTEETRIWQPRFYDFNVRTEGKRMEKLRYMHRNPVKRELVREPEHWAWSSFRHYFGQEPGAVRVNDCAVMEMTIRPPAS
jgi:putative transposase